MPIGQYRNPRYQPPPPPRRPDLVYYPQPNGDYGPAPQDIVYNNYAPPYAEPYGPPMQYGRGINDARVQQPGEEWVRGPDGAFYPPAPGQMTRPRTGNRNYWE